MIYRRRHLFFALLGLLVLSAAGCDSTDQQDAFSEEAFSAPSGYTATSGGQVDSSSIDEQDWRSSPEYAEVQVRPAFPNPVESGTATISVTVPFSDSVRGRLVLFGYDPARQRSSDRLFFVDELPAVRNPGTYSFVVQTAILGGQSGLVRLIVLDEGATGRQVVSYGDLCVGGAEACR